VATLVAPRRARLLGVLLAVLLLVLLAVGLAVALRSSSRPASTPVDVWIEPGSSSARIQQIGAMTRDAPGISRCAYWGQARALADARRVMSPTVEAQLTVRHVPVSFRCEAASRAAFDRLRAEEASRPGVYAVTTGTA
jgi:hypothetical protein